jgi:EAL domain-containing protein (putative c-di-GMP-specific phosphodiesterase class I)
MKGSSGDMFVTASIGVAYAVPNLRLSAEDLMQHADTAMYRAKSAGRNCIALFDDSMLESVTKRLDVETALYRALERNELRLVHQPIVDIDLGIVIGFEALMRWDRKDAGTVSPLDFIPIAEETGTIVPLGSWAINDALQQLRSWVDTGVCTPNTTMSVNVSPRQLHDPEFVTIVSNALDASGVSPEQLWLEVTESVMITEPTQALSSLRRLNALGVRIAIDDFGTGYSSLSLLQKFPIQCIKIDRAFVNDIFTDKATQNIVRTIIAMADAMGADIVAEGVEAALLSSLQSQAADPNGPYQPADLAFIARMVGTDKMNLAEAIEAAQKRAQERQAAQAPSGSPETMPGLAPPGMGAEQPAGPPTGAGGPPSLESLLGQLGGGAGASAQPQSPGGVMALANSLGGA